MRKALVLLTFLTAFSTIPFDQRWGAVRGQPQNYNCSQIGVGCGSCTNDVVNGVAGCWVWSGGPHYECYMELNSMCTPCLVNVTCGADFYAGGACSGVNCTPNQCCMQGMLTNLKKGYLACSCR